MHHVELGERRNLLAYAERHCRIIFSPHNNELAIGLVINQFTSLWLRFVKLTISCEE